MEPPKVIAAGGGIVTGGPSHGQPPTDGEIAATQPTPAGRLQSRYQAMQRRSVKRVPFPGWDGDLVIEVAPIRDRAQWEKGMTAEVVIVQATQRVLVRDDETGELVDFEGGWGPRLANEMGVPETTSASDLVFIACDQNTALLGELSAKLLRWMSGDMAEVELALGK